MNRIFRAIVVALTGLVTFGTGPVAGRDIGSRFAPQRATSRKIRRY